MAEIIAGGDLFYVYHYDHNENEFVNYGYLTSENSALRIARKHKYSFIAKNDTFERNSIFYTKNCDAFIKSYNNLCFDGKCHSLKKVILNWFLRKHERFIR